MGIERTCIDWGVSLGHRIEFWVCGKKQIHLLQTFCEEQLPLLVHSGCLQAEP